jgi:hypothetical protein
VLSALKGGCKVIIYQEDRWLFTIFASTGFLLTITQITTIKDPK